MNENYFALTTLAPTLAAGIDGANLLMSWYGFSGVSYQLYSSTNLFDWVPEGKPIIGNSARLELSLTITSDPAKFFQIGASN